MSQLPLSYLVSNYDIEHKLTGYNVNIILYSHLVDYKTLTDLLPKEMYACFILIETSENSGHWTCVVRNGLNVFYFDSYGVKPDGELSHIKKNLRYELHENKPLLSDIFKQSSNFNIIYNHTQLQSYHPNINTCGKWCVDFTICIFEGGSLKTFITAIKSLTTHYKSHHTSAQNINDIIASRLFTEI